MCGYQKYLEDTIYDDVIISAVTRNGALSILYLLDYPEVCTVMLSLGIYQRMFSILAYPSLKMFNDG
jgi:hypothetical protein